MANAELNKASRHLISGLPAESAVWWRLTGVMTRWRAGRVRVPKVIPWLCHAALMRDTSSEPGFGVAKQPSSHWSLKELQEAAFVKFMRITGAGFKHLALSSPVLPYTQLNKTKRFITWLYLEIMAWEYMRLSIYVKPMYVILTWYKKKYLRNSTVHKSKEMLTAIYPGSKCTYAQNNKCNVAL